MIVDGNSDGAVEDLGTLLENMPQSPVGHTTPTRYFNFLTSDDHASASPSFKGVELVVQVGTTSSNNRVYEKLTINFAGNIEGALAREIVATDSPSGAHRIAPRFAESVLEQIFTGTQAGDLLGITGDTTPSGIDII